MQLLGTVIGGHRIVQICGLSGRFEVFRVEMVGPTRGLARLYLLNDQLLRPELFHELVHLVRSQWPFELDGHRSVVLPEAQVWYRRPWFVVPESMPTPASAEALTSPMLECLRDQLRWLERVSLAHRGFTGPFAHGDVHLERIFALDSRRATWIAPGWVAAADLASQRELSRASHEDETNFELLASAISPAGKSPSDCPVCSKPLPSALKFCRGCGRPLLGRRALRTVDTTARAKLSDPESRVGPSLSTMRELGSGLRAFFGRRSPMVGASSEERDGHADALESSACVAIGASAAPARVSSNTAFCPQCGHRNGPDSRYCSNCGEQVCPLLAP